MLWLFKTTKIVYVFLLESFLQLFAKSSGAELLVIIIIIIFLFKLVSIAACIYLYWNVK